MDKQIADGERLISVAEAVKLLGISNSKLYADIKRGRLPARKFGRRTVFVASELQQTMSALPMVVR